MPSGAPPQAPPTAPSAVVTAAPSSAPAKADEIIGEYLGEDVSLVRIPGFPERTERDPKARTRVEQPTTERVTLIIIDSAKLVPLCTLAARLSGVIATIEPGQRCFDEGNEVEGRVKQGSARFEPGKRLVMDMLVELTLSADEEETLRGEVTYHFDGKQP
jgi:hypothetical protein